MTWERQAIRAPQPGRQLKHGAPGNYADAEVIRKGAMALLIPIVIVLLALDVLCLVDLFRSEEVSDLPKWAWAIVIILMHLLGPIGYLIFGRKCHGGFA